jgi:hypothetical protein
MRNIKASFACCGESPDNFESIALCSFSSEPNCFSRSSSPFTLSRSFCSSVLSDCSFASIIPTFLSILSSLALNLFSSLCSSDRFSWFSFSKFIRSLYNSSFARISVSRFLSSASF